MSERTAAHLTGVTSTVQNASFPNTQPAGFVRLRSRTRHCDVRPRGLRCLPGISVLPAAPRSGSENRAGLKTWSRIWSSCAPKGLQFRLSAPLYSVENKRTPAFTSRLLTDRL
jgi:hypothetical protein